ncbi:MAG: hypothetical protein LBP91_02625 [Coriobacteriales bacterium]|nr:hypothetical protein [Coriobacteriales bacterium]
MIGNLLATLAFCLILTIVLEAGFFFIAGKRNKKDLRLLVLVNVFTNPLVVLTLWLTQTYTLWNSFAVLVPLELFAVVTEGFIYKKCGKQFTRPFLFSLGANAFSYFCGLLIQAALNIAGVQLW